MKSLDEIFEETDRDYIPAPDLTVWRYMDFPKFMSLLQFRKLYFTRADKFQDELEGRVAEFFINRFSERGRESYKKIHEGFEKFKNRTFISCWSEFDKESYAMWQIYSKKYGIALQTTVGRLEASLANIDPFIRKVRYIGYDEEISTIDTLTALHDENNNMRRNFFVLKPEFYEYEKEIRAIITADEEETIKEFEVDIETLVDEVIVSPFAHKWFYELVREIVHNQYGFKNIRISGSDVEVKK